MTAARRDWLAVTFAALLPLAMSWFYFIVLADQSGQPNPLVSVAFSIAKLVQAVFPLAYVVLIERRRPTWKSSTASDLALGIGFAVLVVLAGAALYVSWLRDSPLLADTPARIQAKLRDFNVKTVRDYLALAFFICVIHSLLEEYYWRWFVFGVMYRYLSFVWAAVLASAAFMLHHIVILGIYFPQHFWTLAMPMSLAVGVGGFVWCWLYRRSGSLVASWISHILIDAGILAIGFDLVRAGVV